MNSFPKGWKICPGICPEVIGDRFLVFKTPFSRNNSDFTVKNVIDHSNSLGRKIGLWIDLTNTFRYYNSNEITQMGIVYKKIICEGHGIVPAPTKVGQFFRACREFTGISGKNGNSENLIAVHCTHGHNRTGYLLCHYLIHEHKYTLAKFLKEFSEKRPPGIYRNYYLEDLCKTYGLDFKSIKVPEEPFWTKIESGQSESGQGQGQPRPKKIKMDDDIKKESSASAIPVINRYFHQNQDTRKANVNANVNEKEPNDDKESQVVSGFELYLYWFIRRNPGHVVYNMFKKFQGYSYNNGVINVNTYLRSVQRNLPADLSLYKILGRNKIALNAQNYRNLLELNPQLHPPNNSKQNSSFLVSWKGHMAGFSCLVAIKKERFVNLIFPNNVIIEVEDLYFPSKEDRANIHNFYTILYGKLYLAEWEEKPSLLIEDILMLNGENMMHLSLPKRIKIVEEQIIKAQRGFNKNFNICFRQYWELKNVHNVRFAGGSFPPGLTFFSKKDNTLARPELDWTIPTGLDYYTNPLVLAQEELYKSIYESEGVIFSPNRSPNSSNSNLFPNFFNANSTATITNNIGYTTNLNPEFNLLQLQQQLLQQQQQQQQQFINNSTNPLPLALNGNSNSTGLLQKQLTNINHNLTSFYQQ